VFNRIEAEAGIEGFSSNVGYGESYPKSSLPRPPKSGKDAIFSSSLVVPMLFQILADS